MQLRSSIVQFPRFQTETDPDKRPHERQLHYRADVEPWISRLITNMHLQAARTPSRFDVVGINTKNENAWWGHYHHSRVRSSQPLPQSTNRLHWLEYHNHDYCWDQQALSGRRTELVLRTPEDATADPHSTAHEVAALLLDQAEPGLQRLVLNGSEGWHAPTPAERSRAASLVFAMTSISLNELVVYERERQLMTDGLIPCSVV